MHCLNSYLGKFQEKVGAIHEKQSEPFYQDIKVIREPRPVGLQHNGRLVLELN